MEKIEFSFNERDRRCAVIMMLINTNLEADTETISGYTGVPVRTIRRLKTQLQETRDPQMVIERKNKEIEDARKIRDVEFIRKVQEMIDEDPTRSYRQMAEDLNCTHTTIKHCIREDLQCRSYRRQTGQFLSDSMKERRLAKSVKLLSKLKHPKEPGMIWFFSDEKNFCQDQLVNRQNDRWIAANAHEVKRVMKTKFPATVMVLGVVSSEGDVMPPHIIEEGLRVNTAVYLDIMEKVVVPWCKQIAGDRPWVFQQDSAPAHMSKVTQTWLKDNCYDFVPFTHWPPSSPDCNPMDYFVWGYIENLTNRTSHNTKASLVIAIKEQFSAMPRALVQKACARFRSRLEQVVAAEGGYFE